VTEPQARSNSGGKTIIRPGEANRDLWGEVFYFGRGSATVRARFVSSATGERGNRRKITIHVIYQYLTDFATVSLIGIF
jgi:hypothetical protein